MTRRRRRSTVRGGGYGLVLGVACLAGCHQFGKAPEKPGGPSAVGVTAPSEPVSSSQLADMQVALGRTAEQEGDVKRAMSAYTKALERDQDRADANLRMAIVLDRQGKFRESAGYFEKALRNDPGNPDIFCDMGYSLYLQRSWTDAEMNLKQAIALRPEHRRAHNNLGLVLAHHGQEEEALREFRLAGNDPAQAHNNLAFVLTTERQWEQARKHYQLALAADPNSEEAKARIRELDTLVARLEPPRPGPGGVDPRVVMSSGAGSGSSTPSAEAMQTPKPANSAPFTPPLPPASPNTDRPNPASDD